MITKEALVEFQQLYLKEYGIKLTDQDALEMGTRLVNMVKAVYGNDLPEPKKIDKEAKKEDN